METTHNPDLEILLNTYSSLTSDAIKLIIAQGSYQSYKKSELVFLESRYNAFEYFQLRGISHRYNANEKSQPVTSGIYSGGIVLTPHFARTIESQSIFSVQALTECLYFKVPIGAFDKLRNENPQIADFGQRVVEREFVNYMNFEVLFRSHSAKDRLLYFRSKFPGLENQIPHTIIASYLGITPVSFSRLRNELSRI